MLWRRKRETGGGDVERKPTAMNRAEPGNNVSLLKFEARIELVEDDQVVFSPPILALPSRPQPSDKLHDIFADLGLGRNLRAGGFVALDFETATSSRDSACAVAIAVVKDGRVSDVSKWLIQPPGNEYDGFNIAIHGITPEATSSSPSLEEVWPEVLQWIDGRPIVAHYAPFDLSVLRHSLAGDGTEWPELTYYCTCALARRGWPGRLSYRLPDLANECGLTFEHHEPGADAATAGELAIACCGAANFATLDEASRALGILAGRLTPASWTPSGIAPVAPKDMRPTMGAVPEDNAFNGHTVVFTGTLSCGLTRLEAWQLVVNAGGAVAKSMSKKV